MFIMSEHIIKFICLNVSLKIINTYFSLKLNCHCYYWSLRAVMQYGITFLEKCTFSTTGFRNNTEEQRVDRFLYYFPTILYSFTIFNFALIVSRPLNETNIKMMIFY